MASEKDFVPLEDQARFKLQDGQPISKVVFSEFHR